jgi:hypothetical protein
VDALQRQASGRRGRLTSHTRIISLPVWAWDIGCALLLVAGGWLYYSSPRRKGLDNGTYFMPLWGLLVFLMLGGAAYVVLLCGQFGLLDRFAQ